LVSASSDVIGERPLVDGDMKEVGDLSLASMADEEVTTVDGVFKGALGALDSSQCLPERFESTFNFFMDLLRLIKQDSLSLEEKIIILLRRSGNVVSLVIEWMKGVKIRSGRWGIGTRSTIILIIISLVIKNLIRSESDILDFDGAAQLDTVQLKKSMNIVRSGKIGMIWSSVSWEYARDAMSHSFVKKAWPLYGILRI
ncbi:hypothetical protein Tco_1453466, partial [Tanacetum coccineum]